MGQRLLARLYGASYKCSYPAIPLSLQARNYEKLATVTADIRRCKRAKRIRKNRVIESDSEPETAA